MVLTRRAIAGLVACGLASGCVARGKARFAAYAADAALIGVGLAMTTTEPRDTNFDDVNTTDLRHDVINAGILVAAIGVVAFGATFIIEDQYPTEARPVTPREPLDPAFSDPLPSRPDADPRAVRMAHQARNLAADGNCRAVRQIARQVEYTDRAYYVTVFAVDPPITACL